jgi:hypothetical protein
MVAGPTLSTPLTPITALPAVVWASIANPALLLPRGGASSTVALMSWNVAFDVRLWVVPVIRMGKRPGGLDGEVVKTICSRPGPACRVVDEGVAVTPSGSPPAVRATGQVKTPEVTRCTPVEAVVPAVAVSSVRSMPMPKPRPLAGTGAGHGGRRRHGDRAQHGQGASEQERSGTPIGGQCNVREPHLRRRAQLFHGDNG